MATLDDLTDRALLKHIIAVQNDHTSRLDTIMAKISDLATAEAAEATKIDALLAAQAQALASNAALQASIAALQLQLSNTNLSPADQALVDAAFTDINAKSAAIDAVLTPPTPPPVA